jgi:hypothetical protein
MDPNINDQLAKLKESAGNVSADVLKYAILAAAVLAVLYVVVKVLKRPKRPVPQVPDLAIDVMALSTENPPSQGPALYYYNVPVRLAALVLAPAGRARELPPINQLSDVIDCIVPGLAQVVASHKPVMHIWPTQFSTRGFAHTFFGHAKLPGEGGKGTPWSSAAGTFRIEKRPIMAGLVMRAAAPTNLGQAIIEEEAQWLDILRIK